MSGEVLDFVRMRTVLSTSADMIFMLAFGIPMSSSSRFLEPLLRYNKDYANIRDDKRRRSIKFKQCGMRHAANANTQMGTCHSKSGCVNSSHGSAPPLYSAQRAALYGPQMRVTSPRQPLQSNEPSAAARSVGKPGPVSGTRSAYHFLPKRSAAL